MLYTSIPVKAIEYTTLSDDFNLHFEKDWIESSETESEEFEIPDVESLVNNISSFIAPGYSVYTGEQIPQENTFNKYHYRLNLTGVKIIDDHDIFDAGDIFFRGFVNHQIDDEIYNSLMFDYNLGEFNDGEESNFAVTLFDNWSYDLMFQLELYDDDAGSVDSFGIWEDQLDQSNNSVIIINYGSDAVVNYTLEVLEGPQITTASDLLDAYKPYLFSDVETIYDDPADYVFGRVIEGYDEVKGYNTSCLQYLYYFPYEYSGTNEFVHYWDWEMVLIFIDYSVGRFPYRLVWDNGYYFGAPSGYDWIDGQEYRIFDDYLPEGVYNEEVEFSEALKPLLGAQQELEITIMPISTVFDLTYEKWGLFEWGMPTFQGTIETSYHQFDLGDAGGTDPLDMNRDYDILEFTDDIIRQAYNSLNDSFSGGVHELDGYYTPNYAPFSWDVSQPFSYPYLFTNYKKLATDINAFNDAKESKTFDYTMDKNVKLSLDVPCTVSTEIPKAVNPGEVVNTILNIELIEENTIVTLDLWYDINFTVDLCFWEHTWNIQIDEQIEYNIGNGTLKVFGMDINTNANDDDVALSFEDYGLGDYVTIGGFVDSAVIGTILSIEIRLSIAELIKTLVGPEYAWIVDLIVQGLDLVINPLLDGFVEFDLMLGDTPIEEGITLDQLESEIPVTFTMPSGSTSELQFQIDNLQYGVNFRIDWGIDLMWAMIPGLFIDDYYWQIGSFPNYNIVLAEGSATLNSISKFQFDEDSNQWILVQGIGGYSDTITPSSASIPWNSTTFALGTIVGMILLIQKRKKSSKTKDSTLLNNSIAQFIR